MQQDGKTRTKNSDENESEEGREVEKLQSSACGEDTGKQTRIQICDQQRSTEDMLRMTVKHVVEDLSIQKSEEERKRKSEASAWGKDVDKQTQPTDDIVLLEKDLQSEQITNTSKESGSASDLQSAEKLKLREEEEDFSVLEPLGGSQDSRKAIQEDERVRRSANDHIIENKVHHELSDLSQDPVEHVRETKRDNLCEEQASSALDSSSDNQESAHNGRRCMDASLSSTNLVKVTKGESNFDAQKDFLPNIPVE
ncbi:hypothetical protein ACLOJK_018447 [Asimina triloba]